MSSWSKTFGSKRFFGQSPVAPESAKEAVAPVVSSTATSQPPVLKVEASAVTAVPAVRAMRDFSTYRDAISFGTVIKGKLTFESSVRIDGSLDGEVLCAQNLLISERASVRASLSADTLVIQGVVTGDLKARSKVEVLSGAQVNGTIESPLLLVEQGARVNSKCRIGA